MDTEPVGAAGLAGLSAMALRIRRRLGWGRRRRRALVPRRLPQLRGVLEHIDGEATNEEQGRGLERQPHAERERQGSQRAAVPRLRTGRQHAIDEAGGRARRRHAAEQRDGLPQAIELAPALRAPVEMRLEHGALAGGQRVVHQRRAEIAGFGAVHDRKRSSFSFRSVRARESRERTVPSSRSSAAAISS